MPPYPDYLYNQRNMWKIGAQELTSRLLIGSAQYPSVHTLQQAITASGAEVVTLSLRRQSARQTGTNQFWQTIQQTGLHILPNTAGCYTVQEVITTAEMAREVFQTNWIKLEIIGDDYNLQPHSLLLPQATEQLLQRGFTVLPYCTDDLTLCQHLVSLGCSILMPWAAPIGSGQGLLNPYALSSLRERLPDTCLIIDAGIGRPSDATRVMEMGFDAVLLNSAVALAKDPVRMATAFQHAILAGRQASKAGIMPQRDLAHPSTPVLGTPFWHTKTV